MTDVFVQIMGAVAVLSVIESELLTWTDFGCSKELLSIPEG